MNPHELPTVNLEAIVASFNNGGEFLHVFSSKAFGLGTNGKFLFLAPQ